MCVGLACLVHTLEVNSCLLSYLVRKHKMQFTLLIERIHLLRVPQRVKHDPVTKTPL